jgi:Uncharacterized alpha/beta hydrolase domain (DUF2235)
MLGHRDTVDSVGLVPRSLPFTTSNTIVRTFRHALSLDERRAKYKANLWNRPKSHGGKLSDMPEPLSPLIKTGASPMPDLEEEDINLDKKLKRWPTEIEEKILSQYEQLYAEKEERPTDVEEVWFAVCSSPNTHDAKLSISPLFHCRVVIVVRLSLSVRFCETDELCVDVGGGSVSNKTRNSLARIPLRWMIRECFKANTGILFNVKGLRELGLDPSTLYPFVTPRPAPIPVGNAVFEEVPKSSSSWFQRCLSIFKGNPPPDSAPHIVSAPVNTTTAGKAVHVGTEEEEDLKDALSPIYDQLELHPAWWILEFIPLKLRYQRGDSKWVSYLG